MRISITLSLQNNKINNNKITFITTNNYLTILLGEYPMLLVYLLRVHDGHVLRLLTLYGFSVLLLLWLVVQDLGDLVDGNFAAGFLSLNLWPLRRRGFSNVFFVLEPRWFLSVVKVVIVDTHVFLLPFVLGVRRCRRGVEVFVCLLGVLVKDEDCSLSLSSTSCSWSSSSSPSSS